MKRILLFVLFLIAIKLIFAQQITHYEYWVDGNFSDRTLNNVLIPATDVEISFQYSTSLLQDGIHTLNTRFKDSDNKWSSVQTDFFMKTSATGLLTNQVVSYDYWFDDNFNTRISENIATPSNDVLLIKSIDVQSLTDGLHAINMRFKDASGKWSTTQTDYFIKTSASGLSSNQIESYEYWFDGNFNTRTSENIASPTNDIVLIKSVDVQLLTDGLHALNFRFKDASGKWSTTQTDYFIKTTTTGLPTNQIVSYDYWFDDNFNSRTSENIASPSNDIVLIKSIDVQSLTDGLHAINMRLRDASGKWSTTQTDYFLKTTTTGLPTNQIVSYDYWFDDNFNSRTSENIASPSNDIVLMKNIDVQSLTDGLHAINMRFKDASGKWSTTQTDYFLKSTALGLSTNRIVSCEYWFNEDFSNRINAITDPLNDITIFKLIDVSTLDQGFHKVNFRFKDAAGQWSCVQTDRFKKCNSYYAAPLITGDSNYCVGQTISLSANSSDTETIQYKWSGPNNYSFVGQNLNISNATLARSGQYSCIAIKGSGLCDTSIIATINVTINPRPTASIIGNNSICKGDSTLLIATGGAGYLWSNTNIKDSIYVSTSTNTNYTVTVTSEFGCTSTASRSITVKTSPNVNIVASNSTVCYGYSVSLTASGASTYSWSTNQTGASILVNPTANTSYSVTGTASNGCSKTKEIDIFVDTPPTVMAMDDVTICSGSNINLTATGFGTKTWYVLGNATPLTNTLVSPTNTTRYVVKSENGVCLATYDTVLVNVDVQPSAVAMSDISICQGSSTNLESSGFGTSSWYLLGSSTALTNTLVSPTSTTIYVVKYENGVCSPAYDTVSVMVDLPPTVMAMDDVTICSGSNINLTATGFGTKTWYVLGNATPLANTLVSPTSTTSYVVKSENGVCLATYDTVLVNVDVQPSAVAMLDISI
ncbi:MAG: hypothetical protein PHY85_02990, partial [Bacteroidales bacterium]|nr:hypothetical protein [Bacteroidales bacterium]